MSGKLRAYHSIASDKLCSHRKIFICHKLLRFLKDYWDLANLSDISPDHLGMIDAIVASRGHTFAGTYYSTFTGYINR